MEKLVDLHIHSCASDGTCTPKEIVDKAIEKNISIIALTDHNTVANSKEVRKFARKKGLIAIDGVEIDAQLKGIPYHILALGVDVDNKDLQNLLKQNKTKLMAINRRLIECMSNDYSELNIAEYDKYSYDRTRGGWESINYLFDKGITQSIYGGFPFAEKYACTTKHILFSSVSETINVIHQAGGYAILAHPICYFERNKEVNDDKLYLLLDTMKAEGIDGIECYYPKNTDNVTKGCVTWGKENNMIITGGCDFHGDFLPDTQIGKIKVRENMLSIEALL